MIVGLARSRSRETGLVKVGFQPQAQDVRRGTDSARLEVEYEIGEGQSSTPISNILALRLDSYGSPPDLPSLQDTEALAGFVSSQPRLIYYRQERGFGLGGGARVRESTADLLDPDAVQDRSLQKDLQAISDLGEWWDQRDAQEARRVRDGERDYRDPQLEAIRDLIARIDTFSGVVFNATTSPSDCISSRTTGRGSMSAALSGGERSYVILLADLARRLQVFAPDKALDEIPAIVRSTRSSSTCIRAGKAKSCRLSRMYSGHVSSS